MPASRPENIARVVELLMDLQPQRVLDIGIGYGKYGMLAREYLEIWQDRFDRSEWRVEIIGIEAFEKYRTPLWDYAYDQVLAEDIRRVDLASLGRFDCALFLDVIEHFDHDEGQVVLDRLLQSCDYVIVATPLEFHEQEALFQNEHERHHSLWGPDDYRPYHFKCWKGRSCSVAVLSLRPLDPALGQHSSRYFQFRQFLIRTLPGPAVRLVCLVKSLLRRMTEGGTRTP